MTDKKVPDWLIERFAQNELASARVDASSEALQALQGSNTEILARYPAAQMAKEIKRRAAQQAPERQRSASWAYAFVPVAAVFIAVWVGRGYLSPEPINPSTNPLIEETTAKGLTPKLQLFRQNGELAERLAPNSKTKAGDKIQLSYNSAGRAFGVIVSIDGRGVVTRHLPEEGTAAANLGNSGDIPLKYSYELDDAPRFECFYFVTGDAPFAVDTVINAVKTLNPTDVAIKPLQLPNGLNQISVMIQKEPI